MRIRVEVTTPSDELLHWPRVGAALHVYREMVAYNHSADWGRPAHDFKPTAAPEPAGGHLGIGQQLGTAAPQTWSSPGVAVNPMIGTDFDGFRPNIIVIPMRAGDVIVAETRTDWPHRLYTARAAVKNFFTRLFKRR